MVEPLYLSSLTDITFAYILCYQGEGSHLKFHYAFIPGISFI